MPFLLAAFEQALRQDNAHYERATQSSLHELVQVLRGGFPQPSPANLARLICAVPRDKWRKYSRVKQYLVREIPGLAQLVRYHLGQVIDFRTIAMERAANGHIEHTVGWSSNTGNVEDLAHVLTRERVAWGLAPAPTQPFLVPEYRQANHHNGLGSAGANSGRNVDTHHPVGPFQQPGSMTYAGPTVHVHQMDQTYECSDDGGQTWHTILNSGFTIRRQMAALNGGRRFTITKTSLSTPQSLTHFLDL